MNIIKICYVAYYQGLIADYVYMYPKRQFTFADVCVFLNIKKFVIC